MSKSDIEKIILNWTNDNGFMARMEDAEKRSCIELWTKLNVSEKFLNQKAELIEALEERKLNVESMLYAFPNDEVYLGRFGELEFAIKKAKEI